MSKPKVDSIAGLSPSISVGQHVTNRNPRSTVGTVTDLYTYLRFVYSRLGERPCPSCDGIIPPQFHDTGAYGLEDEDEDGYTIRCSHCGVEAEKFGMAHFSFNKTEGACETCSGLGHVATLDMDAVFNPKLSLRGGAVKFQYEMFNEYYSQILAAAGKHYGFKFDPDLPLEQYGEMQRDLLYYGVESERFTRHFPDTKPPRTINGGKFEGIVTGMWRRYKEKGGEQGRKGDYFGVKQCGGCRGGRLKKEVRAVKVAGASIA